MWSIPSILSYVPPSDELLEPTTPPVFKPGPRPPVVKPDKRFRIILFIYLGTCRAPYTSLSKALLATLNLSTITDYVSEKH